MKRQPLLLSTILLAAFLAPSLMLWNRVYAEEKFPREAAMTASIPDVATAGAEVVFRAVVREKSENAPMEHCDGVVKITRGNETLKEENFHSHDCEANYAYTFPEKGVYQVTIVISYLAELFPVKHKTVAAEKRVVVE